MLKRYDANSVIAATQKEKQQAMIRALRADSCIDHDVPLRGSAPPMPESGPTCAHYFAVKHGPTGQGAGEYWPLHELAMPRWGGARNRIRSDNEEGNSCLA